MASRLSEVRNWTVLLIEAGGDETEISDVPGKKFVGSDHNCSIMICLVFFSLIFLALAGYLQLSELDWKYQTAPPADRAYCQAMIGDRCNWPRGKVMGGSSVSFNSMPWLLR